jgi:tetratricopeptide (TPR) repeat protein
MRTSALTMLCFLALAATMWVTAAPAQEPADVAVCNTGRDQQAAIAACSRLIADRALEASVRSAALVRRAQLYSVLSGRDFITAVEIDPGNTTARKARARHYAAFARSDQAIADYNEAIRLDPNDAEVYRERGNVWLLQKNYSAAVADYRKAIELKPIDSAGAWGQCQASASWTNAFFNCLHVADDASQPANVRAEAQLRVDSVTDRRGAAR